MQAGNWNFLLCNIDSKHDIKSRWNWGSITCIMCFTCVGSQLSINSSNASNLSGVLHFQNRGKGSNCFKKTQIG
uniref:Uncharacterized protein n=1 Tax=Callorhinchus milii TaxID=7868 RepID=A0A4W3I4R4_CALMI